MPKEERKNHKNDNQDTNKHKSKTKTKNKQELKEKINKLKQENEELDAKCRRALVDYQNLQDRYGKEREEFVRHANENLLRDILPIFDNLKISLQHVSREEQDSAWVKGVEYVVKNFREVLEEKGIKEIKVEGENFDHNIMDAIEGKGDKVKKEVKPGYTLNGRVIIPAKVIVEENKSGKNKETEEIEKKKNDS